MPDRAKSDNLVRINITNPVILLLYNRFIFPVIFLVIFIFLVRYVT